MSPGHHYGHQCLLAGWSHHRETVRVDQTVQAGVQDRTGITACPDLTGLYNSFHLTEFAKKTSTFLNNLVVLYKRADSVC